MLKAIWTVFSGFGMLVLIGFILIGAFITDHWRELLGLLLFLGLLVLGAFICTFIVTFIVTLVKDEVIGDSITWLKWGILPEGLRSKELKDKIKKLQIKYGEASDKEAAQE
ncbi:MAG: hypothetical protein F4218_09155 [Synechococcus sp. SB0677_bin_5]|nr:hypothetical protein [Synechococcus sp. SB0677_bin_5]